MTEKPKRQIPLEVFQQLRDRPNYNTEQWLARRIFRHYGLPPDFRRQLRRERAKREPAFPAPDAWVDALQVLREAFALGVRRLPEGGVRAFAESPNDRAEDWYNNTFLVSADPPPLLLVRTGTNLARAYFCLPLAEMLGRPTLPYAVHACRQSGLGLLVQYLDDYLGVPPNFELLKQSLLTDTEPEQEIEFDDRYR